MSAERVMIISLQLFFSVAHLPTKKEQRHLIKDLINQLPYLITGGFSNGKEEG